MLGTSAEGCAACEMEWNVTSDVCTLWGTRSLELSALVISGTSRQKGTFCLWRPLSDSVKVSDSLKCPCCSDAVSKALSESGTWHECIAYAYRCPHSEVLCLPMLFVEGGLLL